MESKLQRINHILNEWDPIGLNAPHLDEYLEYSKHIIRLEMESDSLVEYLERVLIEILGHDFDVRNHFVQDEIHAIANKIEDVLFKNLNP